MRFAGWLALSVMMLFCTAVLADIPGPGPRPRPPRPRPLEPTPAPEVSKPTAPVEVRHEDLSKEGKGVTAKISIPKKVLAKLAADAVPAPAAAAPPGKAASMPWWTTVIAGLMLASGAVGMLFAARGSKTARTVATAALMLGMLTGGYALADLRVPDEPIKPRDTVVFEVVEGESVIITLPGK
jgi:hypothetical protein